MSIDTIFVCVDLFNKKRCRKNFAFKICTVCNIEQFRGGWTWTRHGGNYFFYYSTIFLMQVDQKIVLISCFKTNLSESIFFSLLTDMLQETLMDCSYILAILIIRFKFVFHSKLYIYNDLNEYYAFLFILKANVIHFFNFIQLVDEKYSSFLIFFYLWMNHKYS